VCLQGLLDVARAMADCMHDAAEVADAVHQSHGAQQHLQTLLAEQQVQQKRLESVFEDETAAWHASFLQVLLCRLREWEGEGEREGGGVCIEAGSDCIVSVQGSMMALIFLCVFVCNSEMYGI